MYKILSVRHTGKGHVILRILEDGKSASYTVGSVVYTSLGSPSSGILLNDAEYSEIEADDNLFRARKKALGILSFGDVSESLLRMKLQRAGFARDVADEAVKFVVLNGYLSEERQLDRLIEREANGALRGPYYIKKKMISKGYSSHDVSESIRRLTESGEVDFGEIFDRLCDRMGASDDERLALAYKRGFRA